MKQGNSRRQKGFYTCLLPSILLLLFLLYCFILTRLHYGLNNCDTNQSLVSNNSFRKSNESSAIGRDKDKVDKQKPIAMVHVGPHKTGSTMIQSEMVRLSKELELDGYTILQKTDLPGGHKPSKTAATLAFAIKREREDVNIIFDFLKFLRKNKSLNRNIMISSEEFSRPLEQIENVEWLFEPYFDVHIVVVYRNFYQWLSSLYFEWHKELKDEFDSYGAWIEKQHTITSPISMHPMQPAIVFQEFNKKFANITMINFHGKDGLLAEYFCNKEIGTKHACEYIQKEQKPAEFKNKGHTLEFLRLLNYAISKNLTSKSLKVNEYTMKKTTKKIQDFYERQSDSSRPPLKCLDRLLADHILQHTIKQELVFAPDNFRKNGGETQFKKDFEKHYQSKMCALDIAAIVKEERWISFFKSLGGKT